jgi:sialidase-1
MKSRLAAMVVATVLLMMFAEVSTVRAELWINPLFESYSAANKSHSIVKLSDGSLMVVQDNATRTSTDKGITWSEPRLMGDGEKPGIPRMGPLVRTADGVIVLVYQDVSTYHWDWDDSRGEPVDPQGLDTWAIRSLDDGKTWVDRQMIDKGMSADILDMIVTESGHIVVPVHPVIPDPFHWGACTYVSADNGTTWRRSNLIDMGGVGAHDGVIEATLVELKDGRLYMLMRTSWERFWEAYSWDKGLSWRQVGPSNIASGSSPACLKRLASGRIALVWTSPPLGGEPRPLAEVLSKPPPLKGNLYFYITPNPSLGVRQVSIMFSEDETKTWTKPIVIGRESIQNSGLRYVYLFEPEPGLLWICSNGSHSGIAVSGREADLVGE